MPFFGNKNAHAKKNQTVITKIYASLCPKTWIE